MTGLPRALLLDMWRATPRGWRVVGALVLLGLGAWGVSAWLEGVRRVRLRTEIEEFLATLPPLPVEPPVAVEDDAAPVFLQAFAAIKPGAHIAKNFTEKEMGWTAPPPEFAQILVANAEALRFLEAAVAKPSFRMPPVPGPFPTYESRRELATLAYARAVVELRGMRLREAVDSALLVPRMFRRIGAGRAPPWNSTSVGSLSVTLEILEIAVADGRLDAASAEAILRHLPSGEEVRVASMADFDAEFVRYRGRRIAEMLADDAEARALAMGWRPATLHQRLMAKLGKGKLPIGSEPFPSVSEFRRMWEDFLAPRTMLGLRGPAMVARLAAVPQTEPEDDIYVRLGPALFARRLQTQFSVEARLEVVRAAAALRLFEMQKGRVATSLGELVPEFLPGPTRDPYTEAPLLYETDSMGWRVSSAGPGVPWPSVPEEKNVKPSIHWGILAVSEEKK